jgi:probable HAF family extracellular repeat protein
MNVRSTDLNSRSSVRLASAALAILLYGGLASAQTANITSIAVANSTSVSVSALNNLGHVAGYYTDVNGAQKAFLWDGSALDLGTLGGSISVANDLNELDQVTGYSTAVGDAQYRGFLSIGPTMFNLGSLGGPVSAGTAVNESGVVTGYSYLTPLGANYHAIVSQNGGLTDLGTLGGSLSSGVDINDFGEVAGDSNVPGDFTSHAFLFNGVMNDAGTLGGTFSSANDLNNLGQLVGNATTADDAELHGYIYSDGTMQDLGTLGGTFSSGFAINENGVVIGDSSLMGDVHFHGFIWSAGVMVNLGHLGGNFSSAWALNNANQVVGISSNALGQARAFLWQNGSMVDLNSTLPSGSGWVLDAAYYINDAGQIVGTGLHFGQPSWYLLQLHSSENHPPVAKAGQDSVVECGGVAAVDGTASSDPDGDALSFAWFEGNVLLGNTARLNVSLGLGVHTLRLQVTDPSGASDDDQVVVTVRDTVAPQVVCSSPKTASANAVGVAAVPDFVATTVVTDDCTPPTHIIKRQQPVAGTLVPCGVYQVVLSVADQSGNVGTCTTTFTVVDTTPPVVEGPSSVRRVVGQDCSARVPNLRPELTVTDNCTPREQLVITQAPAPGTVVTVGKHIIEVSVTDAAGNTTVKRVTLCVVDTTGPIIASVSATPNLIRPPNNKMVPVTVSVGSADNCDPAPVCRIVRVESSEPETGPGDKTSPDWQLTGPLTLEVRAEVASGDNRVYTVVVSSTDKSGNSTTSSVAIVVQKGRVAGDEIVDTAAKKEPKGVAKALGKAKKQ